MAEDEIDKWDGAKYSKHSSLQYNYAMQALNEQTFKGNEIILDIGCGDGKITHEIAKRVPKGEVIGIDASESMLQAAQKFTSNNLKFLLKNAEHLDFNNQFDIAISFFCLQWVKDKLSAFKGIAKALKPDGGLLVMVPLIGRLPEITNELMISPRWKKYFVDFGDPLKTVRDTQYDVYAKEAGFQLTTYEMMPITANFSSKDDLFNWLFVVTPHLTRLPSNDAKHNFIEDAIQKYMKEFPAHQDGSYDAEFILIKMIGNV